MFISRQTQRLTSVLVFSILWPIAAHAAERHALTAAGLPAAPRLVAADVCAWPAMTELPDQTLLVVDFNQPSHGRMIGDVDAWMSDDHGNTWIKQGPAAPHDAESSANRMNVAFGTTPAGAALLVCSGWALHPDAKSPSGLEIDHVLPAIVCRSVDAGRTWKIDRDSFPLSGPEGGRLIPFGRILAGKDGALRVPAYSVVPTEKIAAGEWRRVYIFRSADEGDTWDAGVALDPETRLNETTLVHLGAGHWLAFARQDHLLEYESHDDARTWKRIGDASPKSCYPGNALRLSTGEILLTYGNRNADRTGIDAVLSRDEGRTWSAPARLVDFESTDSGYPTCAEIPGGNIVTAYYAKRTNYHDGYHMGAITWNLARTFAFTGRER